MKFRQFLATVTLAAAAIQNAHAVVDQSQLLFNTGESLSLLPIGQSFTAGLSGPLSEIDFYSNGDIMGGTDDVTMEIRSGDGLGGPVLGTLTRTVSSHRDGTGLPVVQFNVLPLGINVTAGSMYTFDFTSATGPGDLVTRGILADNANPYAGGRFYAPGVGTNLDLMFSTSLVPEPATIALLGFGLAGLGFRLRKRNA